jgi:hypothetical protein
VDIRSRMRRNQLARRYIYVGVVLLVVCLPVAINFRELRLACSLYRYEGGQAAFTGKPLSAYIVGTATNTLLPSTLFVTADSGGIRTVAVIHRNGCFVLSAAKPQATIGLHTRGYTPVLTRVGGGYFYVRLKVSPANYGKPSLTLAPISAWNFIRRAVECTSSP